MSALVLRGKEGRGNLRAFKERGRGLCHTAEHKAPRGSSSETRLCQPAESAGCAFREWQREALGWRGLAGEARLETTQCRRRKPGAAAQFADYPPL